MVIANKQTNNNRKKTWTWWQRNVYGYFLFVCDTMKNEKTASILFTVKYIHFIMQISTEFLRQIMSSLSCPFRVVLPFVFICLNFSFVLAAFILSYQIKHKLCNTKTSWEVVEIATISQVLCVCIHFSQVSLTRICARRRTNSFQLWTVNIHTLNWMSSNFSAKLPTIVSRYFNYLYLPLYLNGFLSLGRSVLTFHFDCGRSWCSHSSIYYT